MPRLFFAVRTPPALLPELENLQQEIAYDLNEFERPPKLRAENLANSHCTLRFLGEVAGARIDDLIDAVAQCFEENPRDEFSMSLTRCGVFPNASKARVLWVGLEPVDALRDLRELIDQGVAAAGIATETENGFHPHLTLFRFRDPFPIPVAYEMPTLASSADRGSVSEVVLIESKLDRQGAIHETLAVYPLLSLAA